MKIRRNILSLDDKNFNEKTRFYTAFYRLIREDNADYWNMCAVHGGTEKTNPLRVDYKVLAERYAKDCQDHDLIAQADLAELSETFCPHVNALFIMWHRPFMVAFETLLDKYDPGTFQEKRMRPIAAHYWKWEDEVYPDIKPPENDESKPVYGDSGPIPDFLKTPIVEVFINSNEGEYPPNEGYPTDQPPQRNILRVPNPFITGPSGTSNLQRNIIRANQWGFLRANEEGVTVKEQVEIALAGTDFSKFCTVIDSTCSIEDPHNGFHTALGGVTPMYNHNQYHGNMFGDMNSLYSPFDPIFWVHHSNMERYMFIWLHNYFQEFGQYPTVLVNPTSGAYPTSQNLLSLHLFPFAPVEQVTYASMPWVIDPATFATFETGTVESWIPNEKMPYTYDTLEEGQLPPSITHSIRSVRSSLRELRQKGVLYRIRLLAPNLRGTGTFRVTVNINGRDIKLSSKHFVLASRKQVCLMCNNRCMKLAWDINVDKLGMSYIIGDTPTISIVSASYRTAEQVEQFHNLLVSMEKLPVELPVTTAPPLNERLAARLYHQVLSPARKGKK